MKNIVKFIIPLILVIAIPLILFLQKTENDLQKYDRISQTVFETFNPTGLSVAIVQDGTIIYEKSFGYKNIAESYFMDSDAIFNIASCSKAFTAASIGKLVHEGFLSWDDKVITYIPDFKLADEYISQNLQIRDILSHRTGLGTFYGDLLWYNSEYHNSDVIKRMQYLPVIYDFRTNFGYQNNMYMIAGEIIESVTGQSWENYILQNFFAPLQMTNTRASSDQFDGTENIAWPHFNDSLIDYYHFKAGKPAASIWSNTHDLSNWLIMLLNDGKFNNEQILDPEIIRTLVSAHTVRPVSKEKESFGTHFKNYALGWSTYDYNGKKIIEHNGGMPGYISKVAWIPEEKLGIVILNNGFELFANDALFLSIVDIATNRQANDWIKYYADKKLESEQEQKEFDKNRLASNKPESKPSLKMEKYTGKYTDQMYGDAEIKYENNELYLSLIPAKSVFLSRMEHWADNTFKVIFKDPYLPFGLIQFQISELNEVVGFKIDLPSSDFHFQNLDFKKVK